MSFDVVIVIFAGSIPFFLGKSSAFRTQVYLLHGLLSASRQGDIYIAFDLDIIERNMLVCTLGVGQKVRKDFQIPDGESDHILSQFLPDFRLFLRDVQFFQVFFGLWHYCWRLYWTDG
jgi:hypothetical protein